MPAHQTKRIYANNHAEVTGLKTMNPMQLSSFKILMRLALATTFAFVVTGCGGGGGAGTESLPNTGTVTVSNYNGPAPVNDDVQLFKLNVWDNLVSNNRCGGCHGTGGQSPTFVRSDNINLAYSEANRIINLSSPSESTMVKKVGDGHNCWLTSDQGCADTITQYLVRWAGDSVGAVSRVELRAVATLQDPGTYRTLVEDDANYDALYTLFTTTAKCSNCHSQIPDDSMAQPQSPFFADTSSREIAYAAAKSKISTYDLDIEDGVEPQSRFYIRLAKESHNCWNECQADADIIKDLISDLDYNTVSLPSGSLASKLAPVLPEGTPANTGGRYESNIIAKWEFKAGTGTTAFDTSGLEPAINLNLTGDVEWVGGWGIRLIDGKAQGSTTSSKKLYDLIKASGEYSIETWVAPANVTQEGPAVIANYGGSNTRRNFTLGQTMYNYEFLHRSSTTNLNGEPSLSTMDSGEEVLQATQQHVVVTFNPSSGRKVYVNGKLIEAADSVAAGNLNDWDDSFAFLLGSEPSGANQFQGTIRMLAIHNRALTEDQIKNNFSVGVGQKFYLLFNISSLIGDSQLNSYIVFEVSQFDSYSYLFNAPFFINLDPNVVPDSFDIGGIRIGMNGEEVETGQAFTHLSVSEINAASYSPETGQKLSNIGSILPIGTGPDTDQFFLIFESINGLDGEFKVSGEFVDHLDIQTADTQPRIAVRNFEEVSASMAKLTGVKASDVETKIANYDEFEQSLPAKEDPMSFVPSQNIAITQLAIEYCDTLISDSDYTAERNTLFGDSFSIFSGGADFSGADKTNLMSDLYSAFVGSGLNNQPDSTDFEEPINELITTLANDVCGGQICNASATRNVVTGVCGAALGSATMMIQ